MKKGLKPVFHLATLFARRKAETRIRHRDWLKLAGEKIRREQVGTVPTFFSVRANKVAKWKTGLSETAQCIFTEFFFQSRNACRSNVYRYLYSSYF